MEHITMHTSTSEYPHLQALIDGINEALEEVYKRTRFNADDSMRYSLTVATNFTRIMLTKEGLPPDLLIMRWRGDRLIAKFNGKRSRKKVELLVQEIRGSLTSKKLGIL